MPTKQTGATIKHNEVAAAKAMAIEKRCLDLRSIGASYQQIADTLTSEGSPATANMAMRAVKRGLTRSVPGADQIRNEELAKLDATEMRLTLKFREHPDLEEQLKIEDRINRVRIHRARLCGLFSIKVVHEEYTPDTLNRELALLLQGAAIGKDLHKQDADQ